jgi:hypothetical protein
MTSIPPAEFDLLLRDLERALGCAAMGGRSTGHDILLEGLKRAEYARLAGEPWASSLVTRYQQAIGEYRRFYDM